MQVKKEIFREYDIRGHEKELNEKTCFNIGKAFGSQIIRNSGDSIAIGCDNRQSSKRIKDSFSKGVLSTGCSLIDVNLVPIPALYFSIIKLKQSGGVMITGSHLAKEFNGFKLSASSNAMTLQGKEIAMLRDLIEKEDFEKGKGSMQPENILPEYIEEIIKRITLSGNISTVLDCGNGSASFAAEEILSGIGCKTDALYCYPDSSFPNHHPDPTKEENLKELKSKVLGKKADFGVAFDGDADRIGVVDETGKTIWGDYLLALYSKDLLEKKPGSKIIFEVKCSQALPDAIKKMGGVPIMYKTGHSLIKRKMLEEKAELAGEMSGHMFFKHNYYGFDDALYAAAKLCEILSKEKKPLSKIMNEMPKYYSTPEIRLQCSEKEKWEIVEKAKDYFSTHYTALTIDGVRATIGDGWILIRASNTGPKIIVRAEAKTKTGLKQLTNILRKQLAEFGIKKQQNNINI